VVARHEHVTAVGVCNDATMLQATALRSQRSRNKPHAQNHMRTHSYEDTSCVRPGAFVSSEDPLKRLQNSVKTLHKYQKRRRRVYNSKVSYFPAALGLCTSSIGLRNEGCWLLVATFPLLPAPAGGGLVAATCCLLSAAFYLLPSICCLLSAASCLLPPILHCLLAVT
jgi:hypothetical protein